ncbi:MAG: squalene synthase HpnC [Acidobacteriota bacterium]|nr:squalene synthase HpnC [Acidobacteriota bacterium]
MVASWLLPRRLHQPFFDVYCYCRWSDDLGDETGDPSTALELLDWWEEELDLAVAGRPKHPVLIALGRTMAEFSLPDQPFRDLLKAFRQDQTVVRYPDWESILEYSRYSANPVGRIVLALAGYQDERRQRLSDFTCTGLQLANFWQDVTCDREKGRIYIPLDCLVAHGLGEQDILTGRFDDRYRELMKDIVERTRRILDQGLPLIPLVSSELRVDIDLFSRGGRAVLDAIEAVGYNTLESRPVVRRSTQMRLLGRALVRRWLGGDGGAAERAA